MLSLIPLLMFLSLLAGAPAAQANDIYVAQNSAGAGNGADCADASSLAWFNSSGSWGPAANQIGPGTTVHLCNTFSGAPGSTMLKVQANGTNGNPITIKFEPGALLTAPYWAGAGGGA
jgi:hypothetical protein